MSRYLSINPEIRDHFVYEVTDSENSPLYIGCTRRPKQRLAEHHASNAPWLKLMTTPVRLHGPFPYQKARELERRLIIEKNPKYNVTPDDQSVHQRRNHWLRKRVRELIDELKVDSTDVCDYVALHELASEEANQFNWHTRRGEAA